MLVQQIDTSIIVAIIGVVGGVLPVVVTYVFTKNKEVNTKNKEVKTKNREIDANTLQKKAERYDELISALTTTVRELDVDSLNTFILAYSRASTYASDDVLKKCNEFLIEFEKKPGASVDDMAPFIAEIYNAIRQDIKPEAAYFDVALVTAFKLTEDKSSNQPANER